MLDLREVVYLGKVRFTNSENEIDLYAHKNQLSKLELDGITPETNLLRKDPSRKVERYCCISPRHEFDIRRALRDSNRKNGPKSSLRKGGCSEKNTFIVGIAGGSGAGKTTSAEVIKQDIKESDGYDIETISLDSFYLDHSQYSEEEKKRINYDRPEEWDWNLINKCVEKLSEGEKVFIPQYDFSTHERKNERTEIDPPRVILLEGIYALYDEELNDIMNVKIYAEADIINRFVRRLYRDISERDRTVESVYNQFIQTVQPMHSENVEEQRSNADYIIDGNQELEEMKKSARDIGEEIITLLEGNKDTKIEFIEAPVV